MGTLDEVLEKTFGRSWKKEELPLEKMRDMKYDL